MTLTATTEANHRKDDTMSTPHNSANFGDIAKTVLMPGDPLRAKFIAENYLENPKCFNSIRNMFGYTGEYKGVKLSVMGSGMGIPSIGIYSYELFNIYNVENIIRIGSAGAIADNVKLYDIVLAQGACTNSNYARQFSLPGDFAPIASFKLLHTAAEVAKNLNAPFHVGNVVSSDTFYDSDSTALSRWKSMGVLAIEMEAAGLYMNAAACGKNALCITTISDCPLTGEITSPEERQNSFTEMMEIALETAILI